MWTRRWPPPGHEALDWEGGTRIGAALEVTFNKTWSRRVFWGRGRCPADHRRAGPGRPRPVWREQAERLHLSARRVIWLNPLLRWDGFEAKAQGIRALLPHVDSFVPAHNVNSLEALATTISRADDHGARDRLLAALR